MKISFWRFKAGMVAGIFFTIISFSLIIPGIIFIKETNEMILLMGVILSSLSIYGLFCGKKFLSKIIFSNDGFEVTWLKKSVIKCDWADITEVKAIPCGRATSYLAFVVGNNQIEMGLNKKMYDTIMLLCPYTGIKTRIDNLPQFKWFHRERKK